ncbi:hypothetical protein SmJEL517_g01707 [Synchytrium microbalum]|uniref:SLC41A/MgtE integral membrane domain-containing protein n=1 Tax=Synchytrium microbalum TaxID=1806994 RepID=A0A507CD22_9FUNG|nr:uncharacterized protein SmJEL517_g01707 [Synchytrium microbalum]TPX35946.1 hypothetical protein SmJEL517_g01707 [Synchytrium microbalum]
MSEFSSEFTVRNAVQYRKLRKAGLVSGVNSVLPTYDYDDTEKKKGNDIRAISIVQLAVQILPSLLIALLGLALAGSRLDRLQKYASFQAKPSLFILAPVLLNLKGCLETSLASRISTSAHLGMLNSTHQITTFATGALALLQCRGMVAGCIAGVFAWTVSRSSWRDLFASMSAGMLSACLSGGIMSVGLTVLVVFVKRVGQDPDIFATPLAASVGDLIAIIVLTNVAEFIHAYMGTLTCFLLVAAMFSTLPFWVTLVQRNKHVSQVLTVGALPTVLSLGISSLGGFALERMMLPFPHLAAFAPVINGTSHNLATIFASRLSTRLQVSKDQDTALRIDAMALVIANSIVQILFLILTAVFSLDAIWLHPLVVVAELLASAATTFLLLGLGVALVRRLHELKLNPDDLAFPILTGSSDLLGTCFLGLAALALKGLGLTPFSE